MKHRLSQEAIVNGNRYPAGAEVDIDLSALPKAFSDAKALKQVKTEPPAAQADYQAAYEHTVNLLMAMREEIDALKQLVNKQTQMMDAHDAELTHLAASGLLD